MPKMQPDPFQLDIGAAQQTDTTTAKLPEQTVFQSVFIPVEQTPSQPKPVAATKPNPKSI